MQLREEGGRKVEGWVVGVAGGRGSDQRETEPGEGEVVAVAGGEGGRGKG